MADCPHCNGTGKVPDKEWRVRRTTIRTVHVVAGSREEAVELAKSTFSNVQGSSQTTAAPLKKLELKSPCELRSAGFYENQHIYDGKKVLCGASFKFPYPQHRVNLDPDKLCSRCRALAEKRRLFEPRRVV